MKKIYYYLLFVSLFSVNIFSQGANCGAASPFCAGGSALTFPNSTNTTTQQDVDYQCLGSQPNPAWFYMQIGLAGNIDFHVSQATNGGTPIDVDVMVWGPFSGPTCGPAGLNGNSVYCSFSAAADEYFTIPNAVVGDVYVVLLTNYSGQAGNITLTQDNSGQPGAGATDCNIICPLNVPDEVICPGGQAILTATIAGATSYQWSSSVTGPIAGNTQSIVVTQPATYTVIVNKPGCVANSIDTATVSFSTPPAINPPANIDQCNNIPNFNLNTSIANIFNATGLNPADYEIYFHTTAAGAQNVDGSISTPGAYAGTNGQTVYISVTDNSPSSSGCVYVYSFTLATHVCTLQPAPVQPLVLCDDASNNGVATFDLTQQTTPAMVPYNPANYTITYHLSQAAVDADSGAIGGPATFNNTSNPQTIYIRLEENANQATYGTGSFQLIVNPLPTATISGTTAVCQNSPSPLITFTGANGVTPYTFTYLNPAGASQTITTTAGNSVTLPVSTTAFGTFTYQLVSVSSASTPACSQPQAGSATVTVNQTPTATISGTTAVCRNTTSPLITFTGANGTAPYTFTYLDSNSVSQTITTTVGNSVTLPVSTATAGTFTYQLVSVSSGTPACSQPQTGSATVTVNPIPTATISGTTAVCQNTTSPLITFTGANGITPYTFTYLNPAGASQTITTTAGNSVTLPVSTTTFGTFTYQLVSVSSASTPACSQPQAGSATVTVNQTPTATISGTTAVCQNTTSPVITFTGANGTAPYTFTYLDSNAVSQTITTTVGNSVTLPVSTATAGTFTYQLVSVSSGTPVCSQPQAGSATVTVNPRPTATISGTTSVCQNTPNPSITFTGSNGIAPYTFTYLDANAVSQTITTTVGNTVTLPVSTATPGIFTYQLVSVAGSGTPVCSQPQAGSATVTIVPMPTATISGTTAVCQNTPSPSITFTGANGVAPYTFTYLDPNAVSQTITTTVGNSVTLPVSTATAGTFTYQLVSVAGSGATVCSQPQAGSATVTVNPMPTATISGTTSVCQNTPNPSITFTGSNGIAPYTFTYLDANAVSQTITTTVGNTVTLPVSTATAGAFTYQLVSVAGSGTPVCSQPQAGSVTVTVVPMPTATISGTTSVCQNTPSPLITFTGANGAAPYTFTYLDPNAVSQTITTTVGNSVTLPVSTATAGTFTYQLVSVAGSGATVCSQPQAGSATVIVNPTPSAAILGTTSVCLNSPSPQITLTGSNGTQPYTFTYSINTVVQPTETTAAGNTTLLTVPTSSPGTFTYALVSVSDGSTTACSQAQTGSATVTVNIAPVINTPTDYVVCDDSLNNDGIYCFTLTSKDPEVTLDPNVVITYHETLTDSQTGANPKPSPYCNINPGLQTIYVRAYTLGSPACYSNTSFDLIVNPIPLPNPIITDYVLCDYNNPGDEVEVFDLSTKSAEIANGQANVTVSYYATLADAQTQTSALPNLYPNTSNPQQIWINIRDTNTGCNTTGSFNLIVNPLPFVTQPQTLFQCSNGLVLTATFNLTINEAVVTSNVTGLTVSYYHTLADAQTATSPIPTPATYLGFDTEIVYIRVEDNNTGCYATTTQLLRVTQGPVALTPQPLQYCDPNNDGFGVFTLEDANNEITGTPPGAPLPLGVSVTYHETPDDAFIGANTLTSPYSNIDPGSQIIYVRVFYTLTGCANYVQLKLNVNPTPEATTPQPYELCDVNQTTPADIGYEVFNLNSIIPEILGTINPTLNSVTFYTTLADAQTPGNVIPNPGNYTNAVINTQTIFVRVETSATGCYDIVELQLIVNPLPNSTQPNYPQYSLCDVNQNTPADIGFEVFDLGSKIFDILLGQTGMDVTFYDSLGDAQNGTGLITNLMYQNQIQYVQTLGIRITNSTTLCYVISTMDIRVEPLPVLIPPTQPYTLCDENQDGFTTFDLTTLLPGLLNGVTTYTVTFHETVVDANNNGTSILNPATYINILPFVQIIYVRAEDNTTHCVSVIPIELNVNPSPMAPVALDNIIVCDDDNNPQNAITAVDLTQRTPDVLAQQPLAAVNYTVKYYNSQTAAQSANGAGQIIPDTAYMGTDGETIWVRVENNNTSCFNIGSFQLEINIPLLLTTPTPLSLCDDDANPNNQFHEFDLTVKNLEIAPGGQTVTYYPTYALAQAGNAGTEIGTPTAYTNTSSAVQTLGVVVTTAAGCESITTLDIRVLPIPTPNTNPPALAPKCDDTNPGDMVEYFDLTVNQAYIANGDTTLTFHYFPTQADAESNNTAVEFTPPTNALVGTNVWIRVENNRVDYQGNNCYVIVEQALTVNPLPTVVQPLPPFRVCDDNADGIAQFNLNDPLLAPMILGAGQLPADFTISYHLTAADAVAGSPSLVSPYTNVTPDTQDIYIRVVNNATGCVNATGVLTLAVEEYATATGPQTFSDCDNYADPYDGVHQIDLITDYESLILNGQDPAVFIVSYYTSQADAIAGTNALTTAQAQAYVTDADTDTVWVKVENSSNSITPLCYAITTIAISVERYPNPVITTPNGVNTICVDFNTNAVVRELILDSGITNTTNYSFEWFEAGNPTVVLGTGPTYTVDTPALAGATRDYTVHVTSNSALACDTTSATFPVLQSGQASIPAGTVGYTVTNAFSASQIVTVLIEGYGTYQYSLDDGPRQDSNIFEGVSLGTHIIHVWDNEGGVAYSCEELIITEVQIIDYPHYFTPNGDGIHDTWNIVGLDGQPSARIYIFDRYGKLLKQISSAGNGWDGTYNGHLLPSDDYWFTVDFVEPSIATSRQFKAHFTLKR